MSNPPLPSSVLVRDVVMRDGIQNLKQVLPTELKVEIVEGLADAGIRRIEATSFMNPRAVPATADADEVMRRIRRKPGVAYECLVANERGARRAVDAGCDGVQQVISVTDVHNRANVNRSVKQSLEEMARIAKIAKGAGIPFSGAISLSTGCPYTGRVAEEAVYDIAGKYDRLGVDEFFLCDSMGMGDPARMGRMVSEFRRRWPERGIVVHLHNTRGMGLANALASMQAGAAVLDGSLGGIGGCPFAPNASGNISTEDLAHMLWLMEVKTGVDVDALLRLAEKLAGAIEAPLHSTVLKAGKSFTRTPAPEWLLVDEDARTTQAVDELAVRLESSD